jgi:hypothetical protein
MIKLSQIHRAKQAFGLCATAQPVSTPFKDLAVIDKIK